MTENQAEKQIEMYSGEKWNLGVSEEFKKLAGEYSFFIPTIYQLTHPKEFKNKVIETRGITVHRLIRLFDEYQRSQIFMVEFKNHKFALKIAEQEWEFDFNKPNNGFEEINNSMEVKKLIESSPALKTLNVSVFDFQLGFNGQLDESGANHTYFVSKWVDGDWKNGEEYMMEVNAKGSHEDSEKSFRLAQRLYKIQSLLMKHGFYDIQAKNCFFNAKTEEIMLYDLSK